MTLPKELIPNLDELYKVTCKFVEEHQGERGYIDTQDDSKDTIYALAYDPDIVGAKEYEVHGVRYNDGDLEIVYEPVTRYGCPKIIYTDDDFKAKDTDWYHVAYDELVYYDYTLLRIAESIHEYVE